MFTLCSFPDITRPANPKRKPMNANAALNFALVSSKHVSSEPQSGTNTVPTPEIPGLSSKETMFLDLLSEGMSVTAACERADIPRRSVYNRRRADQAFRERWDEALDMAADTLEAEADRRGRDGWSEDVYYRGQVVGTRQRYSDRMLIFRLRALKPDMYGDV
jgi:hypothetical protein